MAERRMFAKTIIDSDAFLDMPLTTQALYFHLSMRADDDGFINNPKKIQRMVGASDDDARLLIAKQFIIPFESGVVVIKHWKIHNYIRKDTYSETKCKAEKKCLELDENQAYIIGSGEALPSCDEPVTYSLHSCDEPVHEPLTQDRLGKDRLGKDRLGKDRLGKDRLELGEDRIELGKNRVGKDRDREDSPASPPAPKEVRHQYGEYKNVLLSDSDLEKLKAEFPADWQSRIERLSGYIASTGKKYKNHLATIRNWAREDAEQHQPQQPQKEERTYQYGIYL